MTTLILACKALLGQAASVGRRSRRRLPVGKYCTEYKYRTSSSLLSIQHTPFSYLSCHTKTSSLQSSILLLETLSSSVMSSLAHRLVSRGLDASMDRYSDSLRDGDNSQTMSAGAIITILATLLIYFVLVSYVCSTSENTKALKALINKVSF